MPEDGAAKQDIRPLRIGLLHQGRLNPVAQRLTQAVTEVAATMAKPIRS